MNQTLAERPRHSIGFWKNSLVRRFFLLSLLVASLPLVATVFVYDRMTAGLVSDMARERSLQNLAQIKTSMYHFSRQHLLALEAISELPEIPSLFDSRLSDSGLSSSSQGLAQSSQTLSLIHFDIERPEIYGALFFSPKWQLVNALPGQSASGYPYWGQGSFDLSALPKTPFEEALLIGPKAAIPGKSAWYLMALPVRASGNEGEVIGYLAFQLRLASLTEYLSAASGSQVLLCPATTQTALCFDTLARPLPAPTTADESQALFADWQLMNIASDTPLLAREHERLLVLMMAVLVLMAVTLFFFFLVRRVRRRVFPLIDAANAVSVGEWSTRIPVTGNDEISMLARAFNRMTTHLNSLLLARGEAERKAVWGEFATGIAHEIRNPLATIKVCVQSLASDNAEDRELQGLMVGEIDRINQLITGLLEYARPPDPETKQFSLSTVNQRLASLVTPMAKERGIELYVDGDTELCVEADENQIQQIVMNLLINALEASDAGAEIHLSIIREHNAATLVVSDQGCGMNEQQLAAVSQPFYTTKTTGTGLGLSVSHRLAEMNRATLSFSSQPGIGTKASLRFDKECLCESDCQPCG